MAITRKPFQGVFNIIRFNWHFYLLSLLLISAGYYFGYLIITSLVLAASMISLMISWYIYDYSDLYELNWIQANDKESLVVNIHAGFDETSLILKSKFSKANLEIIDFYNPQKHTEVSIKRARRAYPVLPQTISADTAHLPLENACADKIFVIFSAHEIRNETERTGFMKELARIIKPGGEIYITEHLRDPANFIAYNIGFVHFYSKKNWLTHFKHAALKLNQEIKITPFISTFIISRNDHSF
ncbi:class I SAM-dependent methyltransferase [Chitinophaga sancti]|uniref:Class I SAM-dependent methyltransferase n=1 Tax=Chitinophaga sancti TaxID=1004 RepID=A0A1K1SXD5_9BACT|nr:class I SAM-dependent methyltransferase [Chitinophaga sancti]WQD62276.1 class I SAM-dependent methyltransferase [Chitinophaga sancti]WQG92155.1 class I SAM-dependent methyltransferase [Chitinophaga sancti]SFW88955.1 Methyltransferase domain-containing protein [Chitinophaga sancti]